MFVYALLFLGLVSCTKVGPDTSPEQEIEFTSAYVTPSVIIARKLTTPCGDNSTPYWEGKTLNLQGFTWASNIDSVQKYFFLYSKYVLADPTQRQIVIYYDSKDSLPITKLLLANKDKHCFLTVKCLSEENYVKNCGKIIRFTLQRPEDIEFQ